MQADPVQETQAVDDRTYRWASVVLRVGLYLSFIAMSVGLVWWFATGAPGTATTTMPIDEIPSELLAGNPLALLTVGVLVLLATPAATLLTELVTYTWARNWRFAGIAALVAAILLVSIAFSMKWIRLFA